MNTERRAGSPQAEPNPASGKRIDTRLLDERTSYFEDLVAFSQSATAVGCVLPSGLPATEVRPRLGADGFLHVPALKAIGVHGHRIVAGIDGCQCIEPLDTKWPRGRYEVFACLSWTKTPFGELEEEREGPTQEVRFRAPYYRRPCVVLEVGEGRLRHRDWIPIAVVYRESDRGEVASHLDPAFHPFPCTMRAYSLPNPLVQLAMDALVALGALATHSAESRDTMRMLRRLRNVAETASPETVFLLTQECAGKLRSLSLDPVPLLLDGRIEDWQYEQSTFCEFLATVADTLRKAHADLYPRVLDVTEEDGESYTYTRLPGELRLEQDVWTWNPPQGFSSNAFALYFPHVSTPEVPHLRYSNQPQALGRFDLANFAIRISHAGCAAVLNKLPSQCERVHVIADADTKQVRVLQILGEGHAVYYR